MEGRGRAPRVQSGGDGWSRGGIDGWMPQGRVEAAAGDVKGQERTSEGEGAADLELPAHCEAKLRYRRGFCPIRTKRRPSLRSRLLSSFPSLGLPANVFTRV